MKKTTLKEAQNRKLRCLTGAAVCLAGALLLPFLTGQIPQVGSMLLPLHLPVLLCGMVCGWQYGFAVGFVAPILRFILFGMPPIYPTGTAMMFELAAYGAVAGLLYRLFAPKKGRVLFALIGAMLAGRLVWGVVMWLLAAFGTGVSFGLAIFFTQAFANALPGIVLQFVVLPPVVYALKKAGYVFNGE